MKYGILGGTFDPVHCGHVEMACEGLRVGLKQVIVMPCRLSPHKNQTPLSDAIESMEHRWAMLQIAFQNIEGVTLSRFELEGPTPSYTWRTLMHLENERPGDHLVLMLGLDQLLVLDQWANYSDWSRRISYLVFNREVGSPSDIPEKFKKLNIQFIERKISPASSTIVRQKIRGGGES